MPHRFRPLTALFACALALAPVAAPASEGGGEGGGKGGSAAKTAFGPGEHTLQLAPIWVRVAGLRPQRPGLPAYRPLTLILTSRDGGMTTMCHRLPYLTEAFLFALTREDIPSKAGKIDLAGLDTRLLAVADATAPNAVKTLKVVDGTPYPEKSNQEILALCQ